MSGPGVLTVMGIDPGSRITGYGVVEYANSHFNYVASGCIKTSKGEFAVRLGEIYSALDRLISQYQPEVVAIEEVFVARSVSSALKLGQARGAAIAAVAAHELPVAEYAARKVKQTLTGVGSAQKEQVAHMVKVLLGLSSDPAEDAADALALAICYVNSRQTIPEAGS